jgi:S1-C subfamily serine protease
VLAEGFEFEDVPQNRAVGLPGKRGVQVSRVHGGAAREANLQPGDIILRAGREPIRTAAELRKALDAWQGDMPLPLLVRHKGRFDLWTALPRR